MPPKKKFIGAEHVRDADLTMGVEILKTNKTLFVAPLNDEANDEPSPVTCKTMADVFSTFRPKVEIPVEGEDGSSTDSEIRFERITDFAPDSVIGQSAALKAVQAELVILKDMLSQLRQNQNLRRAVDSQQEREILIKGIQASRTALGAKEN